MPKVRVGLVGCGFVSELHMYAYKRVYGLEAEVSAVAARGAHVADFAKKHHIAKTYRDFRDLIADPEIDVIDICTPPMLHASMIVDAMQAGKHVICEKPFAGYFGREGDKTPIGKYVPKSLMYERVMGEMDRDLQRHQGQRQVVYVCGRLGLCAGDCQNRRSSQSHQRQDPVHEGRGKPQRLACRPRCAMGDDRRRLADPHGMPPAFGRALSQAGGSKSARRTYRSICCDSRRRQCRRLPYGSRSALTSRQSRWTSRIGACSL